MDRRAFLGTGLAAAASLLTADNLLAPLPAQAWPTGCIDHLPTSTTKRMAWTVDDGWSSQALRAYIKLLENHDTLRMTMFALPRSTAWKPLAAPIAALVETGRLQIGNHTYTHRDLTQATDTKIRQELQAASHWIQDTLGVDSGAYWRPPFGYINSRVIRVAKEHGFTKPILWYGSTGSGSNSSSASVWRLCQTWMTDHRIVIDHANSMSTVYNFDRILGLLKTRGLHTVTLKQVFH